MSKRLSHRERETVSQHCEASGKAIYETELEARAALIQVQRRRLHEGQKTSEKAVYRCVNCGCWHLTRSLSEPW